MSENTTGAAEMRPLNADDVWTMVSIIGKIGLQEIVNSMPEELVKKSQFRKPTMLSKGKVIEMPRSKWTDLQIQAETEAEIAGNQLILSIMAAAMSHIGECKGDINVLLARATGKKQDEISQMPAIEYVKTLNAFMDREEFSDFFGEALNLVKTVTKQKTPLNGATKAKQTT